MNLGFKEILFVTRLVRTNQYFLYTRRWFQFFMLPIEEEYKYKHFACFYVNIYQFSSCTVSRLRSLVQISLSFNSRFSTEVRPSLDARNIRLFLHVIGGFRHYFPNHRRLLEQFLEWFRWFLNATTSSLKRVTAMIFRITVVSVI
jgi:hypothetical protein